MLQHRRTVCGVWRIAQRAAGLIGQCDGPSTSGRAWISAPASSGSSARISTDSPSTYASRLPTRGVVRMTGKEALEFLQGLVTNDVTPLEVPGGAPVYAALLSPKGKFLHDAFIYSTSGEELLLDVDAASTADVIKWLSRYRLRRHIDISDASREHAVWVQYGAQSSTGGPRQGQLAAAAAEQPSAMAEALGAASGTATAGAAARAAEGAAAGTSAAAGAAEAAGSPGWHADPRLPELGLRALLAASASDPQAPTGVQRASSSDDGYRRLRYQLGVPEGDTEIATGKAAPQEYNLDALHGISYTKGCYVGQERTSFTHHRGIIRKRLMPVRLEGSAQQQGELVGAEVHQEGSSGRSIGTIVAEEGDVGLAHLRLVPALAAIAGDMKLTAGSGVEVLPVRPHWWPESWGLEEGQ